MRACGSYPQGRRFESILSYFFVLILRVIRRTRLFSTTHSTLFFKLRFHGACDSLSLKRHLVFFVRQSPQGRRFERISVRHLCRIARKLSKLEPKVLLRNFPSVEEIQDSASERRLESFCQV